MPDGEMSLLEVASADREAFVLCLALGTYEAMRRGQWPLDSGIWTVGRPCFWGPLASGVATPEVLDALKVGDEFAAMERHCGRESANALLDRSIDVIRKRLAELSEPSWYARWPAPDPP